MSYALFALVVLLPLGVILTACFGYTFKLVSYTAFAIVTALSAVCTVILCTNRKGSLENKALGALLSLTLPFSLINGGFCVFRCSTALIAVCMFVCFCCCGYLAIRYGKPAKLKTITLVISALMFWPASVLGFTALAFGNISQRTVVQSVESPNGVYHAEVIDSDQGALGRDTLVEVYENKGIDIWVIKIPKGPKRVYYGDWSDFKDMEIYWKDDNCPVINSVGHTIESGIRPVERE